MADLDIIRRAHRGARIGASSVGVLAGLSRWKTPLGLYLDKVYQIDNPDEEPAPDENTRFQEWGFRLEASILRAFSDREERLVLCQDLSGEPCLIAPGERPRFSGTRYKRLVSREVEGLITDTCFHPDHDWLLCHPDGIDLGPGAGGEVPGTAGRPRGTVQAKNASGWLTGHWEDERGMVEPPEAYRLQVQTEMMVLSALLRDDQEGHLLGLLGGNDFRHHAERPAPALWEEIVALGAAFIDRLERREPPPHTPDDRGRKDLLRLHPGEREGREVIVAAGTPLWDRAQRLGELQRLKSEVEEAELAARLDMQRAMGDATALRSAGVNITWSASKPGRGMTVDDWSGVATSLRAHVTEEQWERAVKPYLKRKRGTGRRFRARVRPVGENGEPPTEADE